MTQIANQILEQLGGRRFIAMTGARNLCSLEGGRGLGFQLPRGFAHNKATHVRIHLEPTDTYRVEFLKWNGRALTMATISETSGLYCADLRCYFTGETGLDCTMGTIRSIAA